MKRILFTFSFLSLVLFSSCGKDKVHSPGPSPQAVDTLTTGWKKIKVIDSSGLLDIFFINHTGFAAGSHIFKSSDGGDNWSRLTAPSALNSNPFLNVAMGSEMNAVFVSPDLLVSTRNGGASFTTNSVSDQALTDAFFVDSTVAYAVGNSVWKTLNGGDHWNKVYDFPTTTTITTPGFTSLFFNNEQTGWVLKNQGVYKTTNGGIAWERVNTDTISLGQGGAIFFLNADTGYFSNSNSIYKTVNGGASWNKVFTCSNATYHDIHFVSENVGYTMDGPYIFKTTDSGKTWTKVVAVASSTPYLMELHFTDANHGWACGSNGMILKFDQ
jgi:photosystem II stability/assembly factor-like uncharacterized protein